MQSAILYFPTHDGMPFAALAREIGTAATLDRWEKAIAKLNGGKDRLPKRSRHVTFCGRLVERRLGRVLRSGTLWREDEVIQWG
jgi:hypothetical protein